MSFFKISCPGCNKSLKVSESLAGKSRACPYCRATVRIPETAPPEPEPAFPGIQVSETPASGKPRAKAAAATDSGTDRAGAVTPAIQTTAAATTAPAKKAVKRRRREKSWFSSSSDSASSDVSLVLSFLIGGGVALLWYGVTYPIRDSAFGQLFWERGPVPFPTTLLMFWALAILGLKWLNLKKQKDAMLLDVLPTEVSPEITVGSIDRFILHINELPGASSDTFLVNRVVRGIEHFRVRKSAAETVTMMESQSAIDANNVAGSYTILKVFIWSLPILGFIGTVMGVSSAVASLASSLSGGGSMDAMKAALQDVFGGLGTAFDTTLLALIMSMLVKIPASALQKSEEDVITNVDEYCNENLLRRLNDGREGGAERGASGGESDIFRQAVEQALGTHHAEMEQWLSKLDTIGTHLTDQVSAGWDKVNKRIEEQQQKHVNVLHEQQLDQQARLQAQLDQMANAADKIQQTLTSLAEQTTTLQSQVNETFSNTNTSLTNHLSGVQTGLASLSGVLERLGDQQVVVQQVAAQPEPSRNGWFSKKSRTRGRG
ncbi:putative membrane protein [Rhodopirellula maiorica SM1]|uniref:Putative membrane protein n=1 Tax=Rhodopirellula maiorica SM1 TaxID=1265738 RepID=M5RG79_9BACT|nr:MotA/TolQ/ExbB proton channel family protein [Rhodopirellula maiorica]EMI18146.1 putative membrane protein [Rhodopirellula maiorica SM1]